MKRFRLISTICVLAGGVALTGASSAGAANTAQLKAKALSIGNFPTGWSVDNGANSSASDPGCFSGLKAPYKHEVKVRVSYLQGQTPALSEDIEAGTNAVARFHLFNKILSSCTHLSVPVDGHTASGMVGAMSLAPVGHNSAAYSVSLDDQGETFGIDIVIFDVDNVVGDVVYTDIGSPDADQFQAYVNEAVDKIEGKPLKVPSEF